MDGTSLILATAQRQTPLRRAEHKWPNTTFGTAIWKCTFRFSAEPERCTRVTAPVAPLVRSRPALPIRWREIVRYTSSTSVGASELVASKNRNAWGSESTHCRSGRSAATRRADPTKWRVSGRRPTALTSRMKGWWARSDSNRGPRDSLALPFPEGVDYLFTPVFVVRGAGRSSLSLSALQRSGSLCTFRRCTAGLAQGCHRPSR